MANTLSGLMIVLDGLGDRPVPELGGATPLESAHTPNFDALATRGMTGLVHPVAPGVPVSTATGTLALMGVPAGQAVVPRGPVEAIGVGMRLSSGDVALRGNLATARKSQSHLLLLDRRAGRISSGTTELAASLSKQLGSHNGIRAQVRAGTEHRAVMVLSGSGLSAQISDVDPGDGLEERGVLACQPLNPHDVAARRTAEAVNWFVRRSHQILNTHKINVQREEQNLPPANILLPRKAGKLNTPTSLLHALGVHSAVVAGEATLFGLAHLLGSTCITQPSFTGNANTDLIGKAMAAEEALMTHDLVFLHVKATDNLGHDRNAQGKLVFLEQVDQAFAPLLAREDIVTAVCADHSTACVLGRHTGDPVPTILAGPQSRRDACMTYGESSCLAGGLGQMTANNLIWSMLDQMGFTQIACQSDMPFLPLPSASWESARNNDGWTPEAGDRRKAG